jgi:hypothetical protein
MAKWRVVVVWSESEAYHVEADDEDEARDEAIELAMDEHPFADDYDIAWEPERQDATA